MNPQNDLQPNSFGINTGLNSGNTTNTRKPADTSDLLWELSTPFERQQLVADDQLHSILKEQLANKAHDPMAFNKLLFASFGQNIDGDAVENLRQQILSGDTDALPKVKLLDDTQLIEALGAYDAQSDTIFLNQNIAGTELGRQTLLEELGHAIDARVNATDAQGDEGAIFRQLINDDSMVPGQLAKLRAESDQGTIIVNGKSITVEFRDGYSGSDYPWNPGGVAFGSGNKTVSAPATTPATASGGYTGADYPWNPGGVASGTANKTASAPAPTPATASGGYTGADYPWNPGGVAFGSGNTTVSAPAPTPATASGGYTGADYPWNPGGVAVGLGNKAVSVPATAPTGGYTGPDYPWNPGGVAAGSEINPYFYADAGSFGILNADDTSAVYQAEIEHVQEVAQQGNNAATAQAIEDAAENFEGDPELVDDLIVQLQPEIETLTDGIASQEYGRDDALVTVTSLGRVAELATDDGAQVIAATVVRVNDLESPSTSSELWYLDDAVNKVPNGGAITFGLALADQLQLQGRDNAARDVRRDVIHSLDAVTDTVSDTGEARQEADLQLTASLQSFAGFSEQEVADYISAYQAEHDEIYSAEVDNAARLSTLLTRNGDALDQLVVDTVSTGVYGIHFYPNADNLVDSYAALADSSLPAAAFEWAIKEQPDSISVAFERTGNDIEERVVIPATEGVLLQYQAEENGDPEAALDRFESVFNDLELSKSLLSKTSDLTDVQITGFVQGAQETIANSRDLFEPGGLARASERVESLANDADALAPLDAAFEVAGLVFAIANAGDADGFVDNATTALAVTSGGVDLLSKSIHTLNKSGRLGFLSDDATALASRFSRFGARMVPVINVVLNGVATAQSTGKLIDDFHTGRLLAVVGDGLSLVGAVVGSLGVTKPFTAVFEFGGLALSEIGTYWAEAGERNEINDEEEKLLNTVFENSYPELREELGAEQFSDAIRQLADSSDPVPADVFRRAELNTEQLLRLFGTVENSNNRAGRRLLDYAEAVGLTGDDFVEFAQAVEENGMFDHQHVNVLQEGLKLDLTPDQMLVIFDQVGEDQLYFLSQRLVELPAYGVELTPQLIASEFEHKGVNFEELGIDVNVYSS